MFSVGKITSIYKYGYLGCNNYFPMTSQDEMTSIYKYGYLVCNNSFPRTFTKLPAFTNMGTYRLQYSHFLQIQYNSEKMLNFFLQTNKIQEHLKLFELNECIS